MATDELVLYTYWRSSASWRVRIVLGLKGVSHLKVAVPLLEGAQRTDDYLKKNPMGAVPTLRVSDDIHLTQSLAIIEYLEETHPDTTVLPGDAVQRARIRAFAEIVNSGIQPLQNLSVTEYVGAHFGADQKLPWAQHWIERGMHALEEMAKQFAGVHAVGDQVSLADCCLIPQMYACRRFGIDLTKYPTLLRIEEACNQLEAFKQAHPDRQPDAPPS